jgi:hypothetical protein
MKAYFDPLLNPGFRTQVADRIKGFIYPFNLGAGCLQKSRQLGVPSQEKFSGYSLCRPWRCSEVGKLPKILLSRSILTFGGLVSIFLASMPSYLFLFYARSLNSLISSNLKGSAFLISNIQQLPFLKSNVRPHDCIQNDPFALPSDSKRLSQFAGKLHRKNSFCIKCMCTAIYLVAAYTAKYIS